MAIGQTNAKTRVIDVDQTLSATSANPVQNKAVNLKNLINAAAQAAPKGQDCFPFLDASAGAGGKVTFEGLLETLRLAGMAQIAVGSYVGAGTSGVDNQNSLTFDFVPKLLIISSASAVASGNHTGILMHPQVGSYSWWMSAMYFPDAYKCYLSGNTVFWYAIGTQGPDHQCNNSGVTFLYVAFS